MHQFKEKEPKKENYLKRIFRAIIQFLLNSAKSFFSKSLEFKRNNNNYIQQTSRRPRFYKNANYLSNFSKSLFIQSFYKSVVAYRYICASLHRLTEYITLFYGSRNTIFIYNLFRSRINISSHIKQKFVIYV